MSALKTVEEVVDAGFFKHQPQGYPRKCIEEIITQDRADIARVLKVKLDELFEVVEQREDRVERSDVFTLIDELLGKE